MQISTRQLFVIHVVLWLLIEWLVNPIGAFPLNDDWAYAQNVYFLVEEGRFDFSDWMAMTLILQVLWGALVCKIFGFSFTVLRLSTLFLAVMTSWTAFLFFKRFTQHKYGAYFVAILLFINPIFFNTANTFMTEIPFLSVFLPALYFFSKYLDEIGTSGERLTPWGYGLLFSVLAMMVRQPALLLTIAFGLVYLLKRHREISIKHFIIASAPFVLSFASYKLYTIWLAHTQGLPEVYGEISLLFASFKDGSIALKWLSRHNDLIFYCGWFMLPMTLYFWKYYWIKSTIKQRGIAFGGTLLFSSTLFFHFEMIPMGNLISNFGLGPKLLDAVQEADFRQGYVLSEGYWFSIKTIGILGGMFLLFELILAAFFQSVEKRWSVFLCFILFLGYYCFYILNPYYIDRYVLIVIPLLMVFLLPVDKIEFSFTIWTVPAGVSFLLLAWFSIGGTHDYLSWNRVSWNVAHELTTEKGISPAQIKGGFEYVHWYKRKEFLPTAVGVENDTTAYLLSFDSFICGWENKEIHRSRRWLPMGYDSIHLHKKIQSPTTKSLFSNTEQTTPKGDLLTSDTTLNLINRAPQDSAHARSGRHSIRLDKQHRYSFSTTLERKNPCYKITATVWRKRKPEPEFPDKKYPSVIVVKTDDFNFHKNTIVERAKDGWEQVKCEVQLFGYTNAESVNIYLWNNSGETQWFDDFNLTIETN